MDIFYKSNLAIILHPDFTIKKENGTLAPRLCFTCCPCHLRYMKRELSKRERRLRRWYKNLLAFCFSRTYLYSLTKYSGLIRQVSSNAKPTFYQCPVFPSYSYFHRVHSAATGPLSTALYTTEREGSRGKTSIVYVLYMYCPAGRWTVHAKNRQLEDLTVLIKSLVLPWR